MVKLVEKHFSLCGLDDNDELSDEQRDRVLRKGGLSWTNAEPGLTSILFDMPFFGVGLESVWPPLSGDFSKDERQKVWLPACPAIVSATWLDAACSISELALLHWTAETCLFAAG